MVDGGCKLKELRAGSKEVTPQSVHESRGQKSHPRALAGTGKKENHPIAFKGTRKERKQGNTTKGGTSLLGFEPRIQD